MNVLEKLNARKRRKDEMTLNLCSSLYQCEQCEKSNLEIYTDFKIFIEEYTNRLTAMDMDIPSFHTLNNAVNVNEINGADFDCPLNQNAGIDECQVPSSDLDSNDDFACNLNEEKDEGPEIQDGPIYCYMIIIIEESLQRLNIRLTKNVFENKMDKLWVEKEVEFYICKIESCKLDKKFHCKNMFIRHIQKFDLFNINGTLKLLLEDVTKKHGIKKKQYPDVILSFITVRNVNNQKKTRDKNGIIEWKSSRPTS